MPAESKEKAAIQKAPGSPFSSDSETTRFPMCRGTALCQIGENHRWLVSFGFSFNQPQSGALKQAQPVWSENHTPKRGDLRAGQLSRKPARRRHRPRQRPGSVKRRELTWEEANSRVPFKGVTWVSDQTNEELHVRYYTSVRHENGNW